MKKDHGLLDHEPKTHKSFCPRCGRLKTYKNWMTSGCITLTCRPPKPPTYVFRKKLANDV